MSTGPRLTFASPRYLDRLLPLQLGEIQPVGFELSCEVRDEDPLATSGADVFELPLRTLVEDARGDRFLIGLPIFPDRVDRGEGPLVPRSAIALRRAAYDRDPAVVAALLDASEAAREQAYERLRKPSSPALALPWLTDQMEADERRFGGDPFPIGFAANREALALALAELADGLAPAPDPERLFAAESVSHQPRPRCEEPGAVEPDHDGALQLRGLRYADRSLALEVGAVAPVGVDLRYRAAPSLAGALASVLENKFDLAEILLADLLAQRAGDERRLIGLPIFPARRYPQRLVWVPADSRATAYEGLQGARIGFPPGGATAAAWTRALLEEVGVEARFEVGPIGVKMLDRGIDGPTLGGRLLAGELDAVVSPYPVPAEDGGELTRALLADPAAEERAQAGRAGFVPIFNVLAIGREAFDRDPGVVPALIDAFRRARRAGRAGLFAEPPSVALPKLAERVAEAEHLLGGDPYPHGVEANREALAAFARQLAAIGAVPRVVDVEEMFAPQAFT